MAHCLVCARDLGAVVETCPRCQSAYHRECLAYAGRCAVYGCAPDEPAPTAKHQVVLAYDDPGRTFACWMAGGLGFLGLATAMMVPLPGLAMLAAGVAAGCASQRMEAYRVVDPKSRVIWHHRRGISSESLEPELRFDQCRGLRLRRQFALDSAGENCRWVLDLVLDSGDRLILGDGVTPEQAKAVGEMLGLAVDRE